MALPQKKKQALLSTLRSVLRLPYTEFFLPYSEFALCTIFSTGGSFAKRPLTRVAKRVPGVHGKRGLERGWQKRLAENVGEGLAKGWRRVGEGLARGWRRVSKGLADFLAASNFGILEAPV